MSIRIRAIVAILLITLVIISISVMTGVIFVNNNIEKSQEEDLELVSDIADHFISTEINLLKTKTSNMAFFLSNKDEQDWERILDEQSSLNYQFIGASVIDTNLESIVQSGVLPPSPDIASNETIQRAFDNNVVISTTIQTDTEHGVVFYLAAPIPNDPDKIFITTLPGTHFADILSDITVWESGHIFIDDAGGYVISNSRPEWVQERRNFVNMAKEDDSYLGIARVIQRGIDGETGTDQFTLSGEPRLCAFRPISGSDEGWFLGVIAPLSESPFRYIDRGMIAIGVVTIILSFIAAIIASRFIQKPFDRIEELKEIAESHSRAKSDFLANMSHEIRTPMNAIIGMTTIGKSTDNLDRALDCMDKIDEASHHLLGVINDILDVSKIEAGKFELSPVEFNFEKTLSRVVNVIKFRANEKQQNIMVHIDSNIPAFLFGDDQRLAQVITNLIGNSIKFTPVAGTIALDAMLSGLQGDDVIVTITVSDTGIGMTEEQMTRIFDSFSQAEEAVTTRKFGGTGLGLSISKNIVEMMNGRIWVNSTPGEGSTFGFTVLLKKSERIYDPWKDGHDHLKDLRVLIADNDQIVLEYFNEIMGHYDIHHDTVLSGQEALELVEKNGDYDIYFLDWKMPVMNGIELAGELRAKNEDSNIVIITAAEIQDFEEEAREVGVNRFLTKPLFPSTIADVISDYISSDRSLEESQASTISDIFENKKILIAEDVEINREIIQSILEPTKIEIDFAENGKVAVDLFSKSPEIYNLIFMDIQMPGMDGYEATKLIRALENDYSKEIPIVAMTANVYKEDIDKCLAVGMNGHIGKPINVDEVIETLKDYLL